MQMQIWNPWSILDELHASMQSSSTWPHFDIENTDDETLLTADVPGMGEADIEVTVQGSTLIVRGERKLDEGRRSRRYYGAFTRQFHLGDAYDLDDVQAHLADGVLRIRLAKAAKAKPRRIKLTTGMLDKVKGLLGGKKEPEAKAA